MGIPNPKLGKSGKKVVGGERRGSHVCIVGTGGGAFGRSVAVALE